MKARQTGQTELLRVVARIAGAIVLEAPAKPTKHSCYVRAELIRKLNDALTAAGFDMVAARKRMQADIRAADIASGRELQSKRVMFRSLLTSFQEDAAGRFIHGGAPTRERVNKAAVAYLDASGRARNADAIGDDDALAIANEVTEAGFPDDNSPDEEST